MAGRRGEGFGTAGLGKTSAAVGPVPRLVWGSARLTRDLDLTIELEDQRLGALITAMASRYTLLPLDPEAFLLALTSSWLGCRTSSRQFAEL